MTGTARAPSRDVATRFGEDVAGLTDELARIARGYVRQPGDVEDLVQETLTRAWKAYPALGPDVNVRAWLITIMVNTWVSAHRARKRRPAETLVGDRVDGYAPRQAAPSAEAQAFSGIYAREVWSVLASLPSAQRSVAYYAFVAELSNKEIAVRLGIPPGTVMSRLYRARRTLRAGLGKAAVRAA
ncbi:sigma-70 family RNA polymerase sigma factor [[Mycobacterium] kokjensenii]|uniref:Sigma-70 family RNA polymerase sigma factor n=1 Tax=[Mycobacterium] kokjensenii TaxID=3064287 RepID=A0ABM9LIG3_9MYCO|nr:sigma-70 family RNA polymerase sigma factor [Mycolicibacter sp. MU0083]CAJ1499576.1 sigma-70 family RNA polymerase sigma factor [Mycolicibacter sp. MU0083]